ncbi:hypothetical protein K469DRAFT_667475 [Zopfia rhizophila CBS 207.26]|uniref:Heterokaryon incompatibility domain-containing protein n=1 Tax=Zopfia rhizophila CBS 207.26 TaxID=1314779 RepID=A0A6A6DZR3_9PEZI|nr:hypothetical protein K469DRAFT_667475 [Zopfia rhizophila CBS 207.26]
MSKSYKAPSWSCGTKPWDKKIKIDKDGVRSYFEVPESLIEAFIALRGRRKERVLWVDAICINRKDKNEKSQQVPMTSEIYGSAEGVCVWLGEGDEDSKMALDFVQKEVVQLHDFDKLCNNHDTAPKWNAMFNLMKCPWFSHRWIVQEIALARVAQLYCGRRNIPCQDFADAVQLFVQVESATHQLLEVMQIHDSFYHVPRWLEYVSDLGRSLLLDATGTLFHYSKSGTPGKSDRQALLSPEYLLSKLSIFQASNTRDIYALLTIAKDTNPVP